MAQFERFGFVKIDGVDEEVVAILRTRHRPRIEIRQASAWMLRYLHLFWLL